MKKKYYLVFVGFALLVSLLILPQSFLEKTAYRFFRSPGDKLGVVREVLGVAEKTAPGSTIWLETQTGDHIHQGDNFITHGDSKVLFDFDPPFWLMPYSKIEFLKTPDGVIGHLIYGEIKKGEANPAAPPIAITFEEKVIEAAEFSTLAETALITPMVPIEQFSDLKGGQVVPLNVVEKQIFQTLQLHKKFFQGCFIKLYQKEKGTVKSGETVLDLLIQVNGVIEKTTVNKSDFLDPEYLECLKQVFNRVKFKNLQIKEPMHALFPLNIEMPQ